MTERPIPGQEAKELLNRYPAGALVYYFPDEQRNIVLRQQLQATLPDHLIGIVSTISNFPADHGTQVGNSYYGFSAGGDMILEALGAVVGISEEELLTILPEMRLGNMGTRVQEGGLIVPIANANHYLFSHPILYKEGSWYQDSGIEPVTIDNFQLAVLMLRENSPKEEAWLYGDHPDLRITGFARKDGTLAYYVDEYLLETLDQLRSNINKTNARSVPHELVARGACNIKFMGQTVLVPSRAALGEELAGDLKENGFTLAELGEDQVHDGGGIKCRSLDLRWVKR